MTLSCCVTLSLQVAFVYRAYVECGLTFDPATPPTTEDVCKLLAHSPILHVDKVGEEEEEGDLLLTSDISPSPSSGCADSVPDHVVS